MNDRSLFPVKQKITFMQDGAPAHAAKETMKILKEEINKFWSKGIWPGNSPDLNPLESLWAILKDSAYENPKPHDRETLVARFQEKWNTLPTKLLRKLSESFKHRVQEMLNNEGKFTKY
jgi:transposase